MIVIVIVILVILIVIVILVIIVIIISRQDKTFKIRQRGGAEEKGCSDLYDAIY